MKRIEILGDIISQDDKWYYNYYGMNSTSPEDVKQNLPKDGSAIEIFINSGGGDVMSGSEIYTALKQYPGTVNVVISYAASAASVIAMAGDRISMSPVGLFMIHNASCVSSGDYHQMDKTSEVLKAVNKSIAKAYEIKTGLSIDELLDKMDTETWMTAEETVNLGFADDILQDKDQNIKFVASYSSVLTNDMKKRALESKNSQEHNIKDLIKSVLKETEEEVIEANKKAFDKLFF